MNASLRRNVGGGLIALGAIAIALNTILLALDFIAFDDRSNLECVVLVAGVVCVLLGAWALSSARAGLNGFCSAVLLAAVFLFASAFFARLRSGFFFPARSRWLLHAAFAALVVSAAVLGAQALARRADSSRSRP